MDTITEVKMVKAMYQMGGLGILHRYADVEQIQDWIKELKSCDISPIIPSIGAGSLQAGRALVFQSDGIHAVCIDIAHGHSKMMIDTIKELRDWGFKLPIIAGNVSTFRGALDLVKAGANAIKVGIGPGSLCTTRVVTGCGVPQLTAISDCAKIKRDYDVRIIADGGIRNSGDIVKALAFGADFVMIGGLLAGTDETPGEIIKTADMSKRDSYISPYKLYCGMASSQARRKIDPNLASSYVPEGVSVAVVPKDSATGVIEQLVGGIRSGLSYCGARNIQQLQFKHEYIEVTNNAVIEGTAHYKL